jgi:hypothetical protein
MISAAGIHRDFVLGGMLDQTLDILEQRIDYGEFDSLLKDDNPMLTPVFQLRLKIIIDGRKPSRANVFVD